MKHAVRTQALRAYLLVASAAAVVIDLAVMYAGWLFDVPDSAFHSGSFRLAALAAIAVAVTAVRLRCGVAFRTAVGSGDAVAAGDAADRAIVVTMRCPRRRLVCLYARLRGGRAELRA